MKLRLTALTLLIVFVTVLAVGPLSAVRAQTEDGGGRGPLLANLPVFGPLSDGGHFIGRVSLTDFESMDGALLADGFIAGTATTADGTTHEIRQRITGINLLPMGGGRADVCDILILDLGPLHLDLLGLIVDLSEIELDITGETGDGKLLGNLLCAIAGLLDPP
ncbi:MAG: hypothetical protein ACRDIB_11920 [Ardenticatenaceae bacterium]